MSVTGGTSTASQAQSTLRQGDRPYECDGIDSEAPAPTSPAVGERPSPESLDPMQLGETLNVAGKEAKPKGSCTVGQAKRGVSPSPSSSSGGSSSSMQPEVSDSSEDQKDSCEDSLC